MTDLFAFNTHGKKPLKEQVTPHKLSLLVLIFEYQHAQIHGEGIECLSEREKRDFMTTILRLLQSPDLAFKGLRSEIEGVLKVTLLEAFLDKLTEICEEGVKPLMDFFEQLSTLVYGDGTVDGVISKTSVTGHFIRRMVLSFNRLSFSQVGHFHLAIKVYVAASLGEENGDNIGDSLADSLANSLGSLGPLTRSKLNASSSKARPLGASGSGGFSSQKQAEYFISQQAFLLQHNSSKALPPAQLQAKLTAMLKANPDLAEAHFLNYLNSLRVGEYCTAIHNLYHYFDRNATLTGDGSTPTAKNRDSEDISRRYAALNLAALHHRFGHRDEALAALHEAIRMAQETNDHVCLQHALAWLHSLEKAGNPHTPALIERSVSKSGDLSLHYLTSLGVQALSQHNAFVSCKPASVLEYMMKSDILNCQHSLSALMCISYAQKAALHHMYGKRESCSLSSQLVLHLNTSESGVYYNGQAVCMALCNLARLHADKGQFTLALDLLSSAKQRFPASTAESHPWKLVEQEIVFDRALLARRWHQADVAVLNLRALAPLEARLRDAILHREKGEVTEAFSLLNKLLESKETLNSTPDFVCRVELALSELHLMSGNQATALPHIMSASVQAKRHYLQLLHALATVHLAFVQYHMGLPEQAVELLQQVLLRVLTDASVYDQARSLLCFAKSLVAAAAKSAGRERSSALSTAVTLVSEVISKFKAVEAQHRVKDAVYFQARLYNDLGHRQERNKCAHTFQQLDQQYPTLNAMAVNAL